MENFNNSSNMVSHQTHEAMSVGQWIVTMIILAIPILNIIMLLIWAFGASTNVNKKNYSRAVLIIGVVGLILGIILSAAGLFSGLNMLQGY